VKRRRRRRFPRRNNPRPPTYKEAHWGLEATDVRHVTIQEPRDNNEFPGYGTIHSIVYVTTKAGDSGPTEYEHKFSSRNPPLLAYGDCDGRLYIIGGGYRCSAHGIIG